MTTAARNSFGVTLERETAVANTFDSIGELISVGDYEITREVIDVTTHDSAGGYKDYIPAAFMDQADISVEVYFTGDAEQDTVRDDVINFVKKRWRISFPTNPASSVTFEAYAVSFKVSAGDKEAALKASFTLKPTSQPTWT